MANDSITPQPCVGCGAHFAPCDGPTHSYMTSSPACWRAYGELLAREYGDPALFAAAHRLTVDAYALQHPGDPSDRRARQSVWLHYCSLLLIDEHGATHQQATQALKTLSGVTFPERPSTPTRFSITVADMLDVAPKDYTDAALGWAKSALQAWSALREHAREALAGIA